MKKSLKDASLALLGLITTLVQPEVYDLIHEEVILYDILWCEKKNASKN